MSAETPEAIADALGLQPLEGEGGLFRETYRDAHSGAIYYMLIGAEISALHRLASVELFHFYAGAPARMLLLHPDGTATEPTLGPAVLEGQEPQVVVPGGVWQGTESLGGWTLLGTTMAPGFTEEEFELGRAEDLTPGWPDHEERIKRLARG